MNKYENPVTFPSSQNYSVWYDESYYVDKTGEIIKLKWTLKKGSAIFFSRPRRYWKSLFLSAIEHFFSEKKYRPEYFENKKISKDEDLMKRAGKAIVISLSLKEIYNKKENKIDFDKVYIQILDQINDKVFEALFQDKKWFLINYGKYIKILKEQYKSIWYFIFKLVEALSKEKEVFILIDEYDKPVWDCLKTYKNEQKAHEILEELKDEFYTYLKWIDAITILTWVHKLSMASFFSDFNNLKDFSYVTQIWFTEEEVKGLFSQYNIEYNDDIKRWYNWYNYEAGLEFNPWATMAYIERQEKRPYWSNTGTSPWYFRYLINDLLKVRNLDEYLELIKTEKYTWKKINLDLLNENNKNIVLHYLYYAWLLTFTKEKNFAIPNNDVLISYEDLLFANTETDLYYDLRNKSTDALLRLKEDTKYLKEFIEFLLKEKYINNDKKDLNKIWEQIITSDVALIYKTFARVDLRREVNILEWRTDLEYYDRYEEKILFEFKVIRKSVELKNKKEEAIEQINKYNKLTDYDRNYIIIIDLEKLEVLVEEVKI